MSENIPKGRCGGQYGVGKHGRGLEWPGNLIYEAYFRRSKNPLDMKCLEDIVSDQDKIDGLEYVLATLSEKEQFVIKGLYEQGVTLKIVAGQLSISVERVRQIEFEVLRKLRHPSRRCFIEEGLRGTIDSFEIEKAKDDARRLEGDVWLAKVNVEDMDFSVRTYNALKRAGINTLYELVQTSELDLMAVRGFGQFCLNEIHKELYARGLKMVEERTPASSCRPSLDELIGEAKETVRSRKNENLGEKVREFAFERDF